MSKILCRYFGGMLQVQEAWLNKMAEQGYRLVSIGKLLYRFEKCAPGSVQYRVDFIGSKAQSEAQDYHNFLEDIGYKVFFKNINLNYSIGKMKYRPWAEKGGRIATNATTFNKELLIVEKENDGKPFELHTSVEDKIGYYRSLRNPWFTVVVLFIIFGVYAESILLSVYGLLPMVPVIVYQRQIVKIRKEGKIVET